METTCGGSSMNNFECPRCGHCCQSEVCHKDHSKGYEEFEGKCLLCVIDKLMFEIGDLLIKNCTAGEREWQGLTAYEIQEIHSGNQHWGDFASRIEAKLKGKNHG